MKVTVIIPSFKRPSDLRRCLNALVRQSKPADEILVIGRESDEETSDLVVILGTRLSNLRLVPVIEPGVIAALNCGLESATGDILVMTDDDSEPESDWLERIAASFFDDSIGAVGGRDMLQLPDEPALSQPKLVSKVGVLTWYGALHGNHHCPLRGHTEKVMFLKGVNIAFRRRALRSYRIDNRLRGSGAQSGWEMDLCLETLWRGFQVLFDDRILVKHHCAPRMEGDDRTELTGPLFPDISFNNHYLIAKHLGLYQAMTYFFYERLVGSRSVPGLLACLKWSCKGDPHAWRRLIRVTRMAMAGLRIGRVVRATTRRDQSSLATTNPPAIALKGRRNNISAVE
jgi:cellulose synthase/poly-beta-1,6-N-acetylglucosamine synthase-like glycosyltransferase